MAWKKILLEGDAAVLSDTNPVDASFAAASAGAAVQASRQDHKHDIDEGAVGEMVIVDAQAASLGTNDSVSHVDHRHGLGPLAASLDYNQQQAVGLVLEAVATPPDPAAEVEGQIYYDTTVADKHPYIWVP